MYFILFFKKKFKLFNCIKEKLTFSLLFFIFFVFIAIKSTDLDEKKNPDRMFS